jgi:hypothetical protein
MLKEHSKTGHKYAWFLNVSGISISGIQINQMFTLLSHPPYFQLTITYTVQIQILCLENWMTFNYQKKMSPVFKWSANQNSSLA